MKQFTLLLLLFTATSACLRAQSIKTTLSALGNYNTGSYQFLEKVGPIAAQKNHFDYGGEVKISYLLPGKQKLFLSTGLRLNHAQATFTTINTLPGFVHSHSYLKWNYRWWEFTAPLHLGKTFMPIKNSRFFIDVYGGLSLGVIHTARTFYRSTMMHEWGNDDWIGMGMLDQFNPEKDPFQTRFLTTLDIGFNFTPIPSYPRVNLGMFVAYNLQSTNDVSNGGFFANATQGIWQDYYFTANRRFTNFTFSLSYSFGKKWQRQLMK